MKPYYADDLVTLYHCDWREVRHILWTPETVPGATYKFHSDPPAVLLTDPPYGIDYQSGQRGSLPRSIANDSDTAERDELLEEWRERSALVFGSWKRPAPARTRMALVWDKGPALGMGALDLPWKPSWDLIYVLGHGFWGHRDGGVLYCPPVQSMAANGRTHPHEKPVALLRTLLVKSPAGTVIDPFAGTGSTLVAAKSLGRPVIGVELDEAYCEIAATRCSQEVLGLPA